MITPTNRIKRSPSTILDDETLVSKQMSAQ